MRRAPLGIAVVISVLLTLVHAPGSHVAYAESPESVTLGALKDNTLHEDASKSNGSGAYLFSGRTGQGSGSSIRRGLIAFDVAGSIPAGSTIDSATLTLRLNKGKGGSQTMTLHRVDSDWGEGGSSSSGGQGAAAQTNDATWVDRFFNTTQWSTAGGDFQPTSSASTPVSALQAYTWSSAQMAADVQGWLNNPSTNFGWLLKGNEGASRTAKKFDSRESSTPANRPTLLVEFTPPATFSVADVAASEAVGFATLTVTVDPTTSTPVSVDILTSNGTATVGQDFGTLGVPTQVTDTANFAANQASTTVNIPVINDSMDEPDETLTATLTNNSAGTAISSSADSATVTILDDDPAPTVAAPVAVSEDEGPAGTTTTADIVVTLSAASGLPVSVGYSTSDGTATAAGGDYVATSGTLTIAAGSTTGTIQTIINGDGIFESNETFTVTLSNASTTGSIVTITQPTTTVTILDDDPPPTLAAPVAISLDEGAAGMTTTAVVVVTLSVASGLPVSVDYATSDGTATAAGGDYVATNGRLTIPAGDTTGTVETVVNGDSIFEDDETFTVTFSNATTTGSTVTTTQPTTTVTVMNDDTPPALSVADLTVNETDSLAPVTITLSGTSSGAVSVDVFTVEGTATAGLDYTSTTAQLTWAAEENGAKVVMVPLIDDGEVEGAEFLLVVLTNATTTVPGPGGVIVTDGSAVLNIIDDEFQSLIAVPGITQWGLIAVTVLLATGLVWARRRPAIEKRAGRQ